MTANFAPQFLSRAQQQYRTLRQEVFFNATHKVGASASSQVENQRKLQQQIESVCGAANLSSLEGPSGRATLWNQLWTKIRYAGIRSQTATHEIMAMPDAFDNYEWFSEPGWNIAYTNRGRIDLGNSGVWIVEFCTRTGMFANAKTNPHRHKLKKTVDTARAMKRFFDQNPHAQARDFVLGGHNPQDVWGIHRHLLNTGYGAEITALHLMMDVGLNVVKPDIVLTRRFLELGWLHHALPDLPKNITAADLRGKYHYTHPTMYTAVIALARAIVDGLDLNDLKSDIGWCTHNPLREFDLFMVKTGQEPEDSYGIMRKLY